MSQFDLSSKLTSVERKILREEKETVYFESYYQFLTAHNGFRPGKMHTFMGVSHGGKSTLVRSLIIDILKNSSPKKKILLWLSEESKNDFLSEFSESNFSAFSEDQFLIYSEIDHPKETGEKLFQAIEDIALKYEIDSMFIDNLTTSQIYMGKRPDEQERVAIRIKGFAKGWQIPIINILHTGAAVTENHSGIISMNDVRGSKTIANLSEFFYIMQTFIEGSRKHATLRITKHRGQKVEGSVYLLKYISALSIFGCSVCISFNNFKEIYKKRDKL